MRETSRRRRDTSTNSHKQKLIQNVNCNHYNEKAQVLNVKFNILYLGVSTAFEKGIKGSEFDADL